MGEVPARPTVRGPFLFAGGDKLIVKGVGYGTFAVGPAGHPYPDRDTVRQDFAAMAAARVDTVRTYTPPPAYLLEEARRAGLRVMVGVAWGGRSCIYDDPGALRAARRCVTDAVEACAAFRDVVLAYVIGNEIPPLVARYHGWRVVRRFLEQLYRAAKEADGGGLVTYGNYPSTEFLDLDFLDFLTLNVYLREPRAFAAYLDRALVQAKGKPLLLGEIGDDSLRGSEAAQAALLDWTIPLALDKGACGVSVFGWTDDWTVGGVPVEDWSFGLVDRQRRPKPALEVVRRRYAERPRDRGGSAWPRVSVVVCNYDGAATLEETLASLERLDYPDYEIILVDDGSTDQSRAIAERHRDRVRLIAQANHGLSFARNVGARAATGSIVAYIDSDAYADPHWLHHLVVSMRSSGLAGAGGPNLTPESDGLAAQFIALCPGNPTFVLRDSVRAEHVAGVNMAFDREALLAVGGFDPVHTRAGDDVDICWRLEEAGFGLAFSPSAIVWHHRRPSMWRYLKQQYGYGTAENQLERKHPNRFNLAGYIRWRGHVYTAHRRTIALFQPFIYHGRLGEALFQTLYQKEPSSLIEGPAMIQWYALWALVLALSPLSSWLVPFGVAMLGASLFSAVVQGVTAQVNVPLRRGERWRKVSTIAALHFLHPVVRWSGRAAARIRGARREGRPRVRPLDPRTLGRELLHGRNPGKERRRYGTTGAAGREELLRELQHDLNAQGMRAELGEEWDNYDLTVMASTTCAAHVYTAPEEGGDTLCVGLRLHATALGRYAIGLALVVVATVTALQPVAGAALGALAGLAGAGYLVADRGRLRTLVWEGVDRVTARRGATRRP